MSPPPLHNTISPNEFLNIPANPAQVPSPSRRRLVFFITGNPGLVSYYHEFLSLVVADLDSSSSRKGLGTGRQTVVYGGSLKGFEVDGEDLVERKGSGLLDAEEEEGGPWGLRDQIRIVRERLVRLVGCLRQQEEEESQQQQQREKTQVVLVGHSVGAYIALEVIRSLRSEALEFTIDMAILLTPTVMHIALSPSGRVSTALLRYFPPVTMVAENVVRVLAAVLPRAAFTGLVRLAMGWPPEPAVKTTEEFLRSKGGVGEAMFLGREELRDITEDRWEEDEIWASRETKLVFYYAAEDHWVDGRLRDDLIRDRGGRGQQGAVLEEYQGDVKPIDGLGKDLKGKIAEESSIRSDGPTFIVEEQGNLVHGFCIRHSAFVAKKVVSWIRQRYGEE